MAETEKARKPTRRLTRWQVGLAVASVVVAVAGGGLMAYQAATREPTPRAAESSRSGAAGGAEGFAPVTPPPEDENAGEAPSETDRLIDSYSGAVFRLGFGFFAGFAIGYAMRAFVKVTLIVAGVALLLLFGLQYAGLITVDWERISGGFETFGGWASAQTKDFANFITGYLPSAGAGLAGAIVGFRRR